MIRLYLSSYRVPVSAFCQRMTSLNDSSKICCSVGLGLVSKDYQYVATTVDELKDLGEYKLYWYRMLLTVTQCEFYGCRI